MAPKKRAQKRQHTHEEGPTPAKKAAPKAKEVKEGIPVNLFSFPSLYLSTCQHFNVLSHRFNLYFNVLSHRFNLYFNVLSLGLICTLTSFPLV